MEWLLWICVAAALAVLATEPAVQRLVPFAIIRKSALTLTIDSVNFETRSDSPAVVQVAATVVNRGSPTVLHSWQLELRTPDQTLRGYSLAGQKGLIDHMRLPLLLAENTGLNALGCGELHGSLYFSVPGLTRTEVDRDILKSALTVSVSDQRDKIWTASRELDELAAQQIVRGPPADGTERDAT